MNMRRVDLKRWLDTPSGERKDKLEQNVRWKAAGGVFQFTKGNTSIQNKDKITTAIPRTTRGKATEGRSITKWDRCAAKKRWTKKIKVERSKQQGEVMGQFCKWSLFESIKSCRVNAFYRIKISNFVAKIFTFKVTVHLDFVQENERSKSSKIQL